MENHTASYIAMPAVEGQTVAFAEFPAGRHGTVGAVALDLAGNLAAATSTGGMTAKALGRIGDTPVIGRGRLPTTPLAPFPALDMVRYLSAGPQGQKLPHECVMLRRHSNRQQHRLLWKT